MFVSDLLFVNTLMSSLRDIKVFTKKEKENEGGGGERRKPTVDSI